MKGAFVSIAMGCSLMLAGLAHAAGDMHGMDMTGSDAKQDAGAKTEMSHGEIRKIDTAAGKLTIKHGPLENLGMDAMTMSFKVKDPAMMSQVQVGDKIDFVAENIGGGLMVTEMQKR
ncbi:RND transporter [Caballeronia pedi]|uniref:RND transporter n=1 Tax=Caballeronia pedi TaxID=1777141 RepID=A0A158DRX8_9BURK|nr:copper-binding protein [Caballeronia pedi]SAK97372.1 RND transporter [Caballeronia pedi]